MLPLLQQNTLAGRNSQQVQPLALKTGTRTLLSFCFAGLMAQCNPAIVAFITCANFDCIKIVQHKP